MLIVGRHDGSAGLGMATIAPLDFDSQIYGMSMAKVGWLLATGDSSMRRRLKHELAEAVVQEAAHRGYQHLTARVPAREHDSVHALENAGFRTMDVQVTLGMGRPPAGPAPSVEGFVIRDFVPEDLPYLLDFSSDAYAESRLFVDPELPVEASRQLHRQWLENDCRGRAAAVFVACNADGPAGYITCLLHSAKPEFGICGCGDIDLITVSPAARGRGVALALVRHALAWLAGRTDRIIVKTQVTNYAAIDLYRRAGFALQQAFQTLHLWTPGI